MTRRSRIALAWCAITACGPSLAAQQVAPRETTTVYHAAGLRIIHRVRPASPVVAARLFLLGGTRQLTSETQGIEALLLRAAESDSRRRMARIGVQSVVDPGPDWTMTGIVTLRQDFPAAWEAFAGWFGPALPADSAIAWARNRLLAAARRRLSQPDLRIWDLARQSAFEGHAYALEPQGTERSLAAITAEDLERYRAEQLVRSRLLLVIVGDIARADVESLVGRTLARLPAGAYAWTSPPPFPRREPRWMAEHRPLATNYVLGWFVGPAPTDPNYFAFQLATSLLSSRVHRVVRTERTLSYAAYAPFLDRAIPAGGVYRAPATPGTRSR
jgi:zinc protease